MRSFLGIALCFTAGLSSLAQCEADHFVYASNYFYEPQVLQIGQGESVAFINNQGFHDVNGDINTLTGFSYNNPESFYLSPVVGNAAGACIGVVTFNEAGEYNYDCSIGGHAQLGMVASIQVQASVTSGCTYDFACNYNPEAASDDGSRHRPLRSRSRTQNSRHTRRDFVRSRCEFSPRKRRKRAKSSWPRSRARDVARGLIGRRVAVCLSPQLAPLGAARS